MVAHEAYRRVDELIIVFKSLLKVVVIGVRQDMNKFLKSNNSEKYCTLYHLVLENKHLILVF